jgi:anti-sigma factor RsiW
MNCTIPPPLSDDELTAALDGEAAPGIAEHLARCPACAMRLEAARRFEAALRRPLTYWDCPPPERLGALHLSIVSAEEQRAILRHVEECARCADELEALRAFMAEPTPAPAPPFADRPAAPPRPRLRELVAQLLPRALAPALRGIRSETFTAAAGETTLLLDVQRAPDGRAVVQGQILADDLERWAGALVELRQGGMLVQAATVDDVGGFRAGPLPAALSDIRVRTADGLSLLLRDLDLAQTSSG